jgi:hypothetical protein
MQARLFPAATTATRFPRRPARTEPARVAPSAWALPSPLPLLPASLRSLVALALVLCGCSQAAAAEPDEPASSEDELSEPAGPVLALHACSPAPCAGLELSRANKELARCADGKLRPRCELAALDWSSSGLGEDQRARLLVALAPASAPPRVLLRGDLAASPGGPRLAVREAFLSPSELVPEGTISLLSSQAASCRPDACASVRQREVNTPVARAIAHVALEATAPGDDALRNEALVQAFSPSGLLAVGEASGPPGDRSFLARATYLRLAQGPRACRATLAERLSAATSGLLWPSESDYPVTYIKINVKGHDTPEPAELLAALGEPPGTPAERRPLEQVFAWLGRSDPDQSPEEQASAVRFRALRAALERDLTDVRAIAVGEIDLRLYLIGRSRCGELVGVVTTLVET